MGRNRIGHIPAYAWTVRFSGLPGAPAGAPPACVIHLTRHAALLDFGRLAQALRAAHPGERWESDEDGWGSVSKTAFWIRSADDPRIMAEARRSPCLDGPALAPEAYGEDALAESIARLSGENR